MYIYVKSEPHLWTVGCYDSNNKWIPESDWPTTEEAAKRVHYLNGGEVKSIKDGDDLKR